MSLSNDEKNPSEAKEETSDILKVPPTIKEFNDQTPDYEEFSNADDLVQKKQREYEMNAQNNCATNQVFFQEADNVKIFNITYANSVTPKLSEVKSYNLSEINGCIEFVERYKDSEYLAVAIILSIFKSISLGNLANLKTSIMEFLPLSTISNRAGSDEQALITDPYLSLNTVMFVIGGTQFNEVDGQKCARLVDNTSQPLSNFWEQFPSLRTPIVSWLSHITTIYTYCTNFDVCQLSTAFTRIISLDFIDSEQRIFPILYTNDDNTSLLGFLGYNLYRDKDLCNKVTQIINQWMNEDKTWHWKSACLVYCNLMNKGIAFQLESELKRLIEKKLLTLLKYNLAFLARLASLSLPFNQMLVTIISSSFCKADTRDKRLRIARIYVNLIRYSYYCVNSSVTNLALAICTTKEQQHCITPIINQIMTVYSLRKQLYIIMNAYLKELSGYHASDKLINYLSAYFYNMTLAGKEYYDDVIYFLENCQCSISTQIYKRLSNLTT